jgi:putative redox protein
VHVRLNGDTSSGGLVITRELILDGNLDAEQRQRLTEIADKCPVHKTLSNPIAITTTTVPA